MCDIKTPTKFKRKTVYKVAWLIKDKYYSAFSQHELKIGKVVTSPAKMMMRSEKMFDNVHDSLRQHSSLYNSHMLEKVSGFALKSDAIDVIKNDFYKLGYIEMCLNKGYTIVILKMVLSGSILCGTTANIANHISENHHTFASDHIDSMEEIFNHKL